MVLMFAKTVMWLQLRSSFTMILYNIKDEYVSLFDHDSLYVL